jgi:hypothetical protein
MFYTVSAPVHARQSSFVTIPADFAGILWFVGLFEVAHSHVRLHCTVAVISFHQYSPRKNNDQYITH